MSGTILLCQGSPLPLGQRIGRGGEGEVHEIVDGPERGRAVKIYLQPDARREAKIGAIIALGIANACPNVAFPLEIVRTQGGRFAGFTMRRVTGHQPIHQLFAPGSRRTAFPDAGWRFLVRTASNVARIVASVHARGVVIGDINSAGFLVSQQATVTLIDADSFQVATHRCPVGMPEYTPPELQGRRFGDVDRTADHDAFGLGVMIFQILFLGRHPFAGVSNGQPLALEAAITQGRFAYSGIRTVGATPPPATLRLSDLPRSIRLLFERAFAPKGGSRPSAAEWAPELAILEAGLVSCPERSDHSIATLAAPCPWCRIERSTGKPVFRQDSPVAASFAPPIKTDLHHDADRAIRRARRDASETIEPVWPRDAATASKAARQAKKDLNGVRPHTLVHGVRPVDRFITHYGEANVAASTALDGWRQGLGIWDVYKTSDRLRTSLAELERFHARRPMLLARTSAQIIAEQVALRLRGMPLAGAGIAGIGEGLHAHLARHGLRTAADITRSTLEVIGGLGEARIVTLLFWQAQAAVEAERAVTDSGLQAQQIAAAATARLDRYVAMLERTIRDAIDALEQQTARVRKRAARIDQPLLEALQRRDQATADLSYLGIGRKACIRIVSASTVAPASPAPKKRKSKTGNGKRAGQACPICAAPMIKRWAPSSRGGSAAILGCSRYPKCNGHRPARK